MMLSAPCHPERSAGPFLRVAQRSLAALGMTAGAERASCADGRQLQGMHLRALAHEIHEAHEESPPMQAGRFYRRFLMRTRFWGRPAGHPAVTHNLLDREPPARSASRASRRLAVRKTMSPFRLPKHTPYASSFPRRSFMPLDTVSDTSLLD